MNFVCKTQIYSTEGNCDIGLYATATIPRESVVFFCFFLMVFAQRDIERQCRRGVVPNKQGVAHPNEAQPARSDEAALV